MPSLPFSIPRQAPSLTKALQSGCFVTITLLIQCFLLAGTILGGQVKLCVQPLRSAFQHALSGVCVLLKLPFSGRLGGSVGEASDFSSGHDLTVRGFEPHVGLCADRTEPGAHFRFRVFLSLSAPPPLALARVRSLSLKNKH